MRLRSMVSYLRFATALSLCAVALPSFGQFPGTENNPPSDLKAGWDSISIPQAKRILTFLANECEGRGSGQPGFQKAADFVAAHFRTWGLKPMGDNGTFFQNVPFVQSHFVDRGSSIEVLGTHRSIPAGSSFRMAGIGASLDVSGLLAVIRVTGDSVNLGDVDLTGKIAIVFAPNLTNPQRFGILRKGPAAALFVADKVPPTSYSAQRYVPGATGSATSGGRRGVRAPSGTIAAKSAEYLLSGLQTTAAPTEGVVGATVQFSQGMVRLRAAVETKQIGVPNVVAMLEGSDPTLKDEYIGIGGHLDHLGKQGTVVYPGADDDGSGSTAVLSIAHAMVVNPKKPKRSIIFMTFCGEELGLIGSSWYVAHPVVPNRKMVAELQMDMVARDSYGPQNGDPNRMDVAKENLDTIRLVGSKRISTDLDNAIQNVNRFIGFRFRYDAEDVYTRSDHYNFARNGIPIAFLFDGFTPDYHQPGDTVDKIDFLKLTNAAKLYYLTAFAVGDNPVAPRHDVPQSSD